MSITPELQDILNAVQLTSSNLLVEGVAGCGKTTTGVEMMSRISAGRNTALAFNSAIAKELDPRCPTPWSARTMHKMGRDILYGRFRSRIDSGRGFESKNFRFVKKLLPTQFSDHRAHVAALMSTAKSAGVGVLRSNLPETWERLLADQGRVDHPDERHSLAKAIPRIYEASVLDVATIDFGDMLVAPFIHNCRIPKYHNILVDEMQDMSLFDHHWLVNLLDSGGRLFGLGDPNQAIYAFRGALPDSMLRAERTFEMVPLPLSFTWRCPRAVVEEAQIFCPRIRPRPGAPDGAAIYADDYPPLTTYTPNDMILCRNNAPLVSFALSLLAAGIPFNYKPTFSTGLIGFIKSFKTHDSSILVERMTKWRETEESEAIRLGLEHRLPFIADKVDTVHALLSHTKGSIDEALKRITALSSRTEGVRLSTIHSAKGLEAPRVFFLRRDLLPSPYARKDYEVQQERNLEYVAVTRALDTLITLPLEDSNEH